MQIGVLGISHKSSSLLLREQITRIARKNFHKEAAVPLLTCNRTEIYFSADDLAKAHRELTYLLEHPQEPCLYAFFQRECFVHLAAVTSGLESAALGESDIQRQVKQAYIQAAEREKLPSPLHYLFQKSLKIGKNLRSTLPLYAKGETIESVLFRLVQEMNITAKSIFFVGNSEINRKIMAFFRRKQFGRMTLCTRNLFSAEAFALDHGISLANWNDLGTWKEHDLVISGTNSDGYLIGPSPGEVRTRLILDLSVPRTVDPKLGKLSHLVLMNMEQIGSLLEEFQRMGEIEEAKDKIEEVVDTYLALFEKKQKGIFAYA